MALQVNRVLTATSEPLTLEVAKQWMRIDDDPSADDVLITSLITEVRELIEQHLNISMVTYDITVEASARLELDLPFSPVLSVTSVQDRDANDIAYTFDGFKISLDSLSEMVVSYTAGYQAGELPEGLMLGWKQCLLTMYENRGERLNTDYSPDIIIRENPYLTAYDKSNWFA